MAGSLGHEIQASYRLARDGRNRGRGQSIFANRSLKQVSEALRTLTAVRRYMIQLLRRMCANTDSFVYAHKNLCASTR